MNADQAQTQAVFSEKWTQVKRWSRDYVEKNSLPWLAKKYNLPSVDALRTLIRSKKRILDAGCGIGYTLQFFAETNPKAEVMGYDFSPKAVEFARKGAAEFPNVVVVEASHLSCAVFLPNNYFDLVQSEGTIM